METNNDLLGIVSLLSNNLEICRMITIIKTSLKLDRACSYSRERRLRSKALERLITLMVRCIKTERNQLKTPITEEHSSQTLILLPMILQKLIQLIEPRCQGGHNRSTPQVSNSLKALLRRVEWVTNTLLPILLMAMIQLKEDSQLARFQLTDKVNQRDSSIPISEVE